MVTLWLVGSATPASKLPHAGTRAGTVCFASDIGHGAPPRDRNWRRHPSSAVSAGRTPYGTVSDPSSYAEPWVDRPCVPPICSAWPTVPPRHWPAWSRLAVGRLAPNASTRSIIRPCYVRGGWRCMVRLANPAASPTGVSSIGFLGAGPGSKLARLLPRARPGRRAIFPRKAMAVACALRCAWTRSLNWTVKTPRPRAHAWLAVPVGGAQGRAGCRAFAT